MSHVVRAPCIGRGVYPGRTNVRCTATLRIPAPEGTGPECRSLRASPANAKRDARLPAGHSPKRVVLPRTDLLTLDRSARANGAQDCQSDAAEAQAELRRWLATARSPAAFRRRTAPRYITLTASNLASERRSRLKVGIRAQRLTNQPLLTASQKEAEA